MSLIVVFSYLLNAHSSAIAQGDEIRPSLAASVSQRLGVDTDITINFSRPGVKGRKIWDGLVPYGMNPGNNYSNGRPYPWRAGANENTTIEFNSDLLLNGKRLASGKYSIHMIPDKSEWIVIFNSKTDGWGSYEYDEKSDVLRITVEPEKISGQEWLQFGFENLAGNSATAYLHWAGLKIPFNIELDQ